MMVVLLACLAPLADAEPDRVKLGDQRRTLQVEGRTRSYLLHVPKSYDARQPAPVVLAFHGAAMNATMMVPFCNLNATADQHGFLAVYPNGTGVGMFQTFHAGGVFGKLGKDKPDDVRYVAALLDDLARIANVDSRRIFATGMSNGGMMCYRLASELSERIAAIAPVAGTMAIATAHPRRPVPILHFHGTKDRIVPYTGPGKSTPGMLMFKSVEETMDVWVKLNRCRTTPQVNRLRDSVDDETEATQYIYAGEPGEHSAEVVLVKIKGGGHTWPGVDPPVGFLGRTCKDFHANELMWRFFQKHPLAVKPAVKAPKGSP